MYVGAQYVLTGGRELLHHRGQDYHNCSLTIAQTESCYSQATVVIFIKYNAVK